MPIRNTPLFSGGQLVGEFQNTTQNRATRGADRYISGCRRPHGVRSLSEN